MPNGNLTVAETLIRWPATISVFMRYGTACVGCVMAPFETLDEVASIYRLDRAQLLRDLTEASHSGTASDPVSNSESDLKSDPESGTASDTPLS